MSILRNKKTAAVTFLPLAPADGVRVNLECQMVDFGDYRDSKIFWRRDK
jgi:hypothetical protein